MLKEIKLFPYTFYCFFVPVAKITSTHLTMEICFRRENWKSHFSVCIKLLRRCSLIKLENRPRHRPRILSVFTGWWIFANYKLSSGRGELALKFCFFASEREMSFDAQRKTTMNNVWCVRICALSHKKQSDALQNNLI